MLEKTEDVVPELEHGSGDGPPHIHRRDFQPDVRRGCSRRAFGHAGLPPKTDIPGNYSSFIFRLVNVTNIYAKDLADGDGSRVTKVNVKTPQTVMTRVDVPFTLSLSSSFLTRVALTVSAKCSYSAQIYWAVPISTFHHLLRAPTAQLEQIRRRERGGCRAGAARHQDEGPGAVPGADEGRARRRRRSWNS